MDNTGYFCTHCNRTYATPQPDGMCPHCANEALLDLSMREQHELAVDMEREQMVQSVWRYRLPASFLGTVLGGLLGLYFAFFVLPPARVERTSAYVIILPAFLGSVVGIIAGDIVRSLVGADAHDVTDDD